MSNFQNAGIGLLQEIGNPLPVPGGTTFTVTAIDAAGNAIRMKGAGVPPASTVGGIAIGCVYTNTVTGNTYSNTGSVASPVWNSRGDNQIAILGTIATTSTTDAYVIAPSAGVLASATYFTATGSLTANNTNYVTFSITNLGQTGGGSTAMLSTATHINSTDTGTGSLGSIAAATNLPLVLSGTAANLVVAAFDVIRVRATATGTLAGSIALSNIILNFN